MRHKNAISTSGVLLQAGIPKGNPRLSALRAAGMTLRGVVVGVHPFTGDAAGPTQVSAYTGAQRAIYVDVLCYGRFRGVIPRVLWTAPLGLHEGEIQVPRATTIAIGETLDFHATDPVAMDGDHVLIGFAEDLISSPYVIAQLPHPSADVGNQQRRIGHRMRLTNTDGQPRLIKHRGVFFGTEANGDWILDTTRAHVGEYASDGTETPDPGAGNVLVRIPEGRKVTIEIVRGAWEGLDSSSSPEATKLVVENNRVSVVNDGGAGLIVEGKEGAATLTVGDAAVHAAIAEHLEAKWAELVTWLTTCTVLTALGPSAPLPTLAGPPPSWDVAIKSGKVSFPDG